VHFPLFTVDSISWQTYSRYFRPVHVTFLHYQNDRYLRWNIKTKAQFRYTWQLYRTTGKLAQVLKTTNIYQLLSFIWKIHILHLLITWWRYPCNEKYFRLNVKKLFILDIIYFHTNHQSQSFFPDAEAFWIFLIARRA